MHPVHPQPMERPGTLPGQTYKIKWADSDHAIYITVNDIVQDGRRRPFEVLVNSRNMEHFAWTVALTRMISAVFRRGGDVSFVVDELKAVFDPRGGQWHQGRYVPSLLAAIGEVLEEHLLAIAYMAPRTALGRPIDSDDPRPALASPDASAEDCPGCGTPALIRQEDVRCARPAPIRRAGSAVLPLELPEVPARAPRACIPAETRGDIGGRATAYGVGTKQDASLDDVVHATCEPDDQLIEMPSADASWAVDAIETIREASERAAAIGEIALANLWRRDLSRPRSRYSVPDGLLRMLARMERSHAARTHQLSAVEPAVLYRDIAELPLAGALYPTSLLPPAVAAAIVCAINARIRAIALGGFDEWQAVNAGNAPSELVAERSAISSITGAAVRVINQVGHLRHISRRGQTAHHPMTLGRRRALVAAALAQLAEDVAGGPWTPESLSLMTRALRAAWQQRARAEPLPAPRYRDLFAWGDRDCPAPAELDDGTRPPHPAASGSRLWRPPAS